MTPEDNRVDFPNFHTHNGFDAPRVSFVDLVPMPIWTDSTALTSWDAPEGTIALYWDGSTTYKIYARINGTWKSAALT